MLGTCRRWPLWWFSTAATWRWSYTGTRSRLCNRHATNMNFWITESTVVPLRQFTNDKLQRQHKNVKCFPTHVSSQSSDSFISVALGKTPVYAPGSQIQRLHHVYAYPGICLLPSTGTDCTCPQRDDQAEINKQMVKYWGSLHIQRQLAIPVITGLDLTQSFLDCY